MYKLYKKLITNCGSSSHFLEIAVPHHFDDFWRRKTIHVKIFCFLKKDEKKYFLLIILGRLAQKMTFGRQYG